MIHDSSRSIEQELFQQDRKKILVVEDADSILIAINDYLTKEYSVTGASDGREAEIAILDAVEENQPFDLMVTDIHLPDKSGFDLIRFARKFSPSTKIALITSYEINEYMDTIYHESIDQVITKHSNMSLHDIGTMAHKIISGDIFGIGKYFEGITTRIPTELTDNLVPPQRTIFSVILKSSEEKLFWINTVAEIFHREMGVHLGVARLVLDELLTNAMVRAAKFEDGSYKYQIKNEEKKLLIPHEKIILAPEDYVILQYGFYEDFAIIACIDPHGTLRKQEILYRLHRHISLNPETRLPEGISDTHGRGLFLLREHLTYLVFNIQKERKTEVIGIFNTRNDIPYKNISIFEIE